MIDKLEDGRYKSTLLTVTELSQMSGVRENKSAMATKKKAKPVKGSDLEKAVAGMEKATKELSLHIKTFSKAVAGHLFAGDLPKGHWFTK